jgi:chromosome segregation ATPase
MTTPLAHEARITALEYAVFEQFPHTLEAMLHPLTRANALATENGEAMAGLRVDMAALQTSVHGDVANLKAALDLHNDSLRNQLAEATAEFRASVTGVREEMSLRFQKADGQFNGVHGEIATLKADVGTLREDVAFVKADVGFLKEEVTIVQGDVSTLKTDVSTLKTDVSTLKTDVSELKGDLATFKGEVREQFAGVSEKFAGLGTTLDTLIAEIRGNRD